MKYVDENAIKKLISLIKGDLAKKQDSITVSGLLKGNGTTISAADTQEATLVDVPNGLLKGDGTTISAAIAETDYMVPPAGGTIGQILKKTETGTEWADESCAADAVQSNLDTHVNNTTIHVTAEEKSTWNAKLDSYTETDPTVPDWAKQSTKPTYTADEVGAATMDEVNSAIQAAIGNAIGGAY